MIDLRDQLGDFEAAAHRPGPVITLTSDEEIGRTLRQLRRDSGLTMRQLGARAHLSPSGIAKREQSRAGRLGALLDHVQALGCVIALLPDQPAQRGRRETGTGWPA